MNFQEERFIKQLGILAKEIRFCTLAVLYTQTMSVLKTFEAFDKLAKVSEIKEKEEER